VYSVYTITPVIKWKKNPGQFRLHKLTLLIITNWW